MLHQLGEIRLALDRLREAEALAERLNDERRRGRVYAVMTSNHALLGELDEALATGARALAIARTLGDLELRVATTSYLEMVHASRGDHERVVELATENLAALPADWQYKYLEHAAQTYLFDRFYLVGSLGVLGRFAQAAGYEAEAIALAEATHRAYLIGWAHLVAGRLHLVKGDWAKARSLLEGGITVMRRGNVGLLLPHTIASSALALAQLGEASEALTRFREGAELTEHRVAKGIVESLGPAYMALGRVALLLGRLDDARRFGERALNHTPAGALILLGEIAAHPDQFDPDRAEVHYRRALVSAEPRGMRPNVAQCHLGLGRLYRRTGQREQAHEHLTIATALYREMDMTYWLEQAAGETAALG